MISRLRRQLLELHVYNKYVDQQNIAEKFFGWINISCIALIVQQTNG